MRLSCQSPSLALSLFGNNLGRNGIIALPGDKISVQKVRYPNIIQKLPLCYPLSAFLPLQTFPAAPGRVFLQKSPSTLVFEIFSTSR